MDKLMLNIFSHRMGLSESESGDGEASNMSVLCRAGLCLNISYRIRSHSLFPGNIYGRQTKDARSIGQLDQVGH